MILNTVRACLDNYLSQTPNLPVISYQNVPYQIVNGTPYIKTKFIPTSIRPATRGLNPQKLYTGIYQLLVCTPENVGSGSGYDIADKLIDRFKASTDISYSVPSDLLLTEGGAGLLTESGNNLTLDEQLIITVDYTEVGTSFLDSPFYCTPVTVAWYIYHQ